MYTTANTAESPPNFVSMSLLRQMVNNPSTRTQLEADPVAAFAAHGIEINAPADAKLPKMEAISSWIEGGDMNDIVRRWSGLLS